MTAGSDPASRAGQPARPHLRASDSDREHVINGLKTAFTEGRLTKDEYDTRVEQTFSANSLATASLMLGIGQLFLTGLAGIPAIILGLKAHRQIRETGEQGYGAATAGVVLGTIGVSLLVIFLVFSAVAHYG